MRLFHFPAGVSDRLGESKVDDFHFQFRRLSVTSRQHDIGGFQVTMNQTVRCCSHQCPRDLDCNFQNQFGFKRTIPAYAILQGFALYQLHGVIAVATIRRSPELEDSSHIWMSQSSGSTGFTQKSFTHRLRSPRSRRDVDHFQGNLAMQDIVPCEISYSHRPATEFTKGALFVSHDLEIAEDERSIRLCFDH